MSRWQETEEDRKKAEWLRKVSNQTIGMYEGGWASKLATIVYKPDEAPLDANCAVCGTCVEKKHHVIRREDLYRNGEGGTETREVFALVGSTCISKYNPAVEVKGCKEMEISLDEFLADLIEFETVIHPLQEILG